MAGLHIISDRASSRRLATLHHGFTMVELILVIVLIGIISAVGISRFFERSSFDASAWTDQVRSILRYGQKIAVAQNRPVRVLLRPDRVALCFDPACSPASQVVAPSGSNSGSRATRAACASASWMCEGRPDGVTMTVPASASVIVFDALGRASPGATIEIGGDGLSRAVIVEAETGYVN